MMKPVPTSVSVFAGAVLSHAFFYIPGVASALLYLLHVKQTDVNRVQKQCGLTPLLVANLKRSASDVFPSHILHLVVSDSAISSCPSLPQDLRDYVYGAWTHRWWQHQDSDVFASFLKHYYIIASDYIALTSTAGDVTPDEAIVATPGILLVHASILSLVDSVVHRDRRSPLLSSSSPSSSAMRSFDTGLAAEVNATMRTTVSAPSTRQLSQMRFLLAFKEVLDRSGPTCTAYATTYSRFFETTVLHAAAKRISLYDAESCVMLCDLVEATLTTLSSLSRTDQINWAFWLDVVKRLLASESSMTEIRAIAFLYSFWDYIAAEDEAIDWILSPSVWKKFFCHWAPLVRAYYMRLICWRVVRSTSPRSAEAVDRLVDRLSSLYVALRRMAASGRVVGVIPCSPVPGRRMALIMCSGRDTAAHQFFLASMKFRQEILSAVETEPEGKVKSVANRYDVHDEEVYIAAISSPTSGVSGAAIASPTTAVAAAKGLAIVFRRLKVFKSSSSSDSQQQQQQQQESTIPVAEFDPAPEMKRHLRRSASTSSTSSNNSTSSIITSDSALTISPSQRPVASNAASLLGSERSYCFMLQPTDQHRQQHHTAASSTASLPLQSHSQPPSPALQRGAHIPVPRLPFASQSVMAMASQRSGGRLALATPPASSASSFISALQIGIPPPVIAQASPVPSRASIFEATPSVSPSSQSSLPTINPHGNTLRYAGHAVSEWNSVVRQFERFVDMRRTKDGVDLDLDIGTPSVVGDMGY